MSSLSPSLQFHEGSTTAIHCCLSRVMEASGNFSAFRIHSWVSSLSQARLPSKHWSVVTMATGTARKNYTFALQTLKALTTGRPAYLHKLFQSCLQGICSPFKTFKYMKAAPRRLQRCTCCQKNATNFGVVNAFNTMSQQHLFYNVLWQANEPEIFSPSCRLIAREVCIWSYLPSQFFTKVNCT